MSTEIDNIITLLERTFHEGAWHGPTVKQALKDLTDDGSLKRLPDTHSIIEIVAHMTAWRTYTIRKLEGDAGYKVSDELNFPVTASWPAVMEALEESQRQLVQRLKSISPEKLSDQVPGSSTALSFYVLLHGIIHHDLYHAGQIVLIRKASIKQSF